MSALLGVSVWVTLAMVVPGLITMAVVFGALETTRLGTSLITFAQQSPAGEWIITGLAVTCMVMTQAVGILLENLLTRLKWLGAEHQSLQIPPGIDPCGELHVTLSPYEEYQGVYLLLSELREGEDSHGHLQRVLSQFFLSNNTMVSFAAGIALTTYGLIATSRLRPFGLTYLLMLSACLVITFLVVRIRFNVMARALWAARRRRLEDASGRGETSALSRKSGELPPTSAPQA